MIARFATIYQIPYFEIYGGKPGRVSDTFFNIVCGHYRCAVSPAVSKDRILGHSAALKTEIRKFGSFSAVLQTSYICPDYRLNVCEQ